MSAVIPVRMPKWGLSMEEGKVVGWWKDEGAPVREGEDLVDIETAKINNVFEAPASGVLRRILAQPGETLPVGALIGVLADADTADAEIDTYVRDFQTEFAVAVDAGGEGELARDRVQAGGRTLEFARAGRGDGPPVVLLHGFASDLDSWAFNLPALIAHAEVLALDLPGHGASDKDVGDGSLGALAADIAGALAALDVSRAHLVGHSLGGAVAARLAADHPALAQSLTLISPAYLPGGAVNGDFIRGVAEGLRARDLRPWLELLTADPGSVTREMVDAVARYKRLDGVESALQALAERLLSGEDATALQADLARIPSARVIASRADQIVGAPDPDRLPPGWSVSWIEGAGHLPHLEQAERVNGLLLQALGVTTS